MLNQYDAFNDISALHKQMGAIQKQIESIQAEYRRTIQPKSQLNDVFSISGSTFQLVSIKTINQNSSEAPLLSNIIFSKEEALGGRSAVALPEELAMDGIEWVYTLIECGANNKAKLRGGRHIVMAEKTFLAKLQNAKISNINSH